MQTGEKAISGWRPHPTKTLTKPWETGLDILSRQCVPLQRKSCRELKAAPGGKGAGIKAALTAQPEKKLQCTYSWAEATAIHSLSNTHAHSTPPSSTVNTGSMHTQRCSNNPGWQSRVYWEWPSSLLWGGVHCFPSGGDSLLLTNDLRTEYCTLQGSTDSLQKSKLVIAGNYDRRKTTGL